MPNNKKHAHGKKNHDGEHHDHTKSKKMIHHDWRFWTAIALMLVGMLAYVFSLDEAMRPGGVDQPEIPAMAE